MSGLSIADIISQANALSSSGQDAGNAIAQDTQSRVNNAIDISNNIREAGTISANLQKQKSEEAMQAQQYIKRNAAALGIDASQPTEIISKLGSQIRNDALTFNAASEKLQNIDANDNLLSNPLGWFNSLMNRQETAAVVQQSANRIKQSSETLKNLYALGDADRKTQLALADTTDASDIALEYHMNLLKADSEAKKAAIEASTFDIEGRRTLQQFGSEEFSRQAQIYNMMQNQQMHAETMKMRKLQYELDVARLNKMNEPNVAQQYLAALVNKGNEVLGQPPIPPEAIGRLYGTKTPEGNQLELLAQIGSQTLSNGSAKLGNSPYETWSTMAQLNKPFPKSMDPALIKNFEDAAIELKDAMTKAAAIPHLEGGRDPKTLKDTYGLDSESIKNESAVANVFNSIFKKLQNDKNMQIPNKPIDFKSMENMPDFQRLKETPTFKTAIEPIVATADTPISVPRLAPIVAQNVIDGKLTAEEAAKTMADFSSFAYNHFSSRAGYKMVGANMPEGNYGTIRTPANSGVVQDYAHSAFGDFIDLISTSTRPYKSTANTRTFLTMDTKNPTDWITYFQLVKANKGKKEISDKYLQEINK